MIPHTFARLTGEQVLLALITEKYDLAIVGSGNGIED